MSKTNEDTKSTAPEQAAVDSSDSTKSDGEILISQEELTDLGNLLNTFKNILIAHETRLVNVEQFLASAVDEAVQAAEDSVKPKLTVVSKGETDPISVSENTTPEVAETPGSDSTAVAETPEA